MKTILVCGHGPGISDAVARRFGAEGFSVALVARNGDRLATAAAALAANGVTARAFPCDLGDAEAVQKLVAEVRASLAPVTVVHWNAYAAVAGDLVAADVADLRRGFDVSVTGLVAAVQAALPDLKAQKNPAVLVTGGGFAFYDPQVDAMAVAWSAMGLAVAKAAQHKLAGLLHEKLRADGVYVGELVVLGMVKGTAFDAGHATLEPAAIAQRFWELYEGRTERSVTFG
ncbi:MAG: SDR family NAD(P)-dependent oxidoreductase [Myxococcales bacterium]|nr:SDR family NAD(P)-dependent oxidoreductase [Myxococcales bacterium]